MNNIKKVIELLKLCLWKIKALNLIHINKFSLLIYNSIMLTKIIELMFNIYLELIIKNIIQITMELEMIK